MIRRLGLSFVLLFLVVSCAAQTFEQRVYEAGGYYASWQKAAVGYLQNSNPPVEVKEGIKALDRAAVASLDSAQAAAGNPKLTSRERDTVLNVALSAVNEFVAYATKVGVKK